MNKQLIKIITTDNRFAFVYIVIFFFVGYMAVFESAGAFWVAATWGMLSVLGVIVTVTAYVSLIEALASKKWVLCKATLLEAKVSCGIKSDNGEVCTPEVQYEYSFGGERYRGNQIDFSAFSSSEAWAQSVVDKISDDEKKFKVYVNPAEPDVSVIMPGARFVHLLRFIVGPAMTVFGVLFGFGVLEL